MAEGKLSLRVLDVYGNSVGELVDVFMKNQTLSDAPAFRDLNFTTAVEITGLNVFPNGSYRLEVDASSYQAVSRFVNIPPDGKVSVAITLPVNPKKVLRVQFPAFDDPQVPNDARELLRSSSNVLNFSNKSGKVLYDALDDIRKAGFLNLVAKANRTHFPLPRGESPSVLSFIQELVELRGDRFFSLVNPELRSATINSMNQDLFHEVDEALHTPPPGFGPARSFKTFDHYGNLQLSFFSSPDGRVALDMDIDDAQGFDHIFQVVGNVFAGPTHPYNIHEILIASQELDPGYQFVLHEAQQAGSPRA